ncbi:hypothetical protein DB30_00951 [Enhygromyxa salina]|uniref:Methyltransferase type 11 domain-containing protein n=1 Tax=Enhygromyxa salina TaxID=215803 RepID=A0A0C1Z5K6_9BACT|nr:methyltransferase domain-containing protein [Enhygromyxa salina]KIG12884.1 hypothetical protein DB30_00951 [Enhygromyxa salina]
MHRAAFRVVVWTSVLGGAVACERGRGWGAGEGSHEASHEVAGSEAPTEEHGAELRGPRRPPALGSEGARDHAAMIERARERLLEHAQLGPGMSIAEIGASRGWFVDRAALALGPTGVVYATDIDPEAVAALRELAARANPERARIEVRACADERDTGLREVPDGSLQRMLMIDSLCFDGRFARADDVVYLRELLRTLAPDGRLIHHMDCACEATAEGVIELFEEAGFAATVRRVELPQPDPGDPTWTCQTPAQRERHELVFEFSRWAKRHR